MPIDKARLLIRVANQLPDSDDRRALLAWADEILAGAEGIPEPGQLNFPIPVFRRYKGKLYQGQLLKGWRIQLNGKVYPTPSAAAVHVSTHNENGWRMWRYIDESTDKEYPIERLRSSL
jgi:hypothetical protein